METSKSNNNVGKKLKMLRAEYDFTQEDIAKKLGITQQTYSKYEQNGNLSAKDIKKICEIYGISSDYLLGIEPKKSSKKITKTSYDIDYIVNEVISKLNKE